MCNNCIHKPVCSKFTATGGHVRECEHFKEEWKGEWLEEQDGDRRYHVCSVCSEYPLVNEKWGEEQLTDYCPNCGADMRGTKNG